jgi:hypothetical protein
MDANTKLILELVGSVIEKFQTVASEEINHRLLRPLIYKAFQDTPDADEFVQGMGMTQLVMSDGNHIDAFDFFQDGKYPRSEDAPESFTQLMEVITCIDYPYHKVTFPNGLELPLTRENVLKHMG